MSGRRPSLGSVRLRVTALSAIAVAVVLVASAALLLARQRSGLLESLDDQLESTAELLADGGATGESPPLDDALAAEIGPDGGVLSINGDEDEVAALARAFSAGDRTVTVDGERFRLASEEAGDGRRVVVAGELDDVDESVRALRRSLAVIVPVAVVVLAALVWLAVGRALRPVERIRAEVAAIGAGELDRRVPVPAGRDEIARLATTMNSMLERVDAAMRRQQRFVADASHELRTPLARMRTELEVDERMPERADVAATRRSQLDEIGGLQRLVDDLLLLARADSASPLRSDVVELDEIVLDEAHRSVGGDRGIEVDLDGVEATRVRGDADALRRVVRNLLDNAHRHADRSISVGLGTVGTAVVLTVGDDGPGVAATRRAEIFERFTRLDEARHVRLGGTGLGLAIVRDVVTRHGGAVAVGDDPSGGAQFTITLPVATEQQ